ncbi:MAG: alanine racemase [Parvularculaceae bacterium]
MRAFKPYLDIDLAALCRNYRRLADMAPASEAASVVKCDAYGLGAAAVGAALMRHGKCRSFFVAYCGEGAALREALGSDPDIYIFNGPFETDLDAFREFRLIPVVNTIDQARLWAIEMKSAPAAIHIDTGMHRLGMPLNEAQDAAAADGLNVSLVMSHLACASDPAHPMNARQRAAMARLAALFPAARLSLSSSGGALLGAPFAYDMTRLGVGLYGVSPHETAVDQIEPVVRLSAPVLQVQEIEAGETVGYGASFTADRKSVLATVALGYGDGFPRAGSNRAAAVLGGAPCPIAGRVSMDLIVLDATDAPNRPDIGDRAEFFGPAMPIDAVAKACGTIGYELLTAIGGLAKRQSALGLRVERRYLWNGAPADATIAGE